MDRSKYLTRIQSRNLSRNSLTRFPELSTKIHQCTLPTIFQNHHHTSGQGWLYLFSFLSINEALFGKAFIWSIGSGFILKDDFTFNINSNISHQLHVVFWSVKVAWRSWFSIPLAHLNPYVVWKLPRNNLINTIRKTKNSLKQRYNVIFVSAQVLLVLTLGLWTLYLGLPIIFLIFRLQKLQRLLRQNPRSRKRGEVRTGKSWFVDFVNCVCIHVIGLPLIHLRKFWKKSG